MSPGKPDPTPEARLLAMAELALEAQALSEAALLSDWDEVRFRTFRLMEQGFDLRSRAIAQTAHDLSLLMGPAGSTPAPGYGAAIAALSQAIGDLI